MNRLLLVCMVLFAGCAGQRRGSYSSGNPVVQPANAAPAYDDCPDLMEECMFYGMDEAYCRKMTRC